MNCELPNGEGMKEEDRRHFFSIISFFLTPTLVSAHRPFLLCPSRTKHIPLYKNLYFLTTALLNPTMPFFNKRSLIAVAATALLPAVHAHGQVKGVLADGVYTTGPNVRVGHTNKRPVRLRFFIWLLDLLRRRLEERRHPCPCAISGLGNGL